jgi:hypothetical protein
VREGITVTMMAAAGFDRLDVLIHLHIAHG